MPELAPGIGDPGYARRVTLEAVVLLHKDPVGSAEIDLKLTRLEST